MAHLIDSCRDWDGLLHLVGQGQGQTHVLLLVLEWEGWREFVGQDSCPEQKVAEKVLRPGPYYFAVPGTMPQKTNAGT